MTFRTRCQSIHINGQATMHSCADRTDGFEFRCDDGTPLHVTFALDCRDREAISWAATTGGHGGDVVRDVMLAAIEQRFGTTQATQPIEWLSDYGSDYSDHRTRSFALELGLSR